MSMNARLALTIALAILVLAASFPAVPAGIAAASPRTVDNDNDLGNATSCTSGQSYPRNIDIADDPVDLFSVTAPIAGQIFNVSVYVASYPTCKIVLSVFDLNYVTIDQCSIDSPWQSLSVQAVKSNTPYYVGVNVLQGASDYTLYYTLETPLAIAPGNTVSDRPLARAGDNPGDWYMFAMASGTNNNLNNDIAEFTIDKTAGMILDVTIIALWTELTQYTYNISLDHKSGAMITAAASYSANYYIRLWARSGSGTYNITMGVLQNALNDRDNDEASATKLNNTPVNSWVDQSYDHYDWYKVYLVKGETLDVNMTLNQHSQGKYALWLYHKVNNLYTLVANATNFVPGVGWTDKVRLTKTVEMDNRYFLLPMAECGLDASGAVSSVPANASYTLALGAPADINHGPVFIGSTYVSMDENVPKVIFNLNTAFEDPDGDQMFFNVTGSGNLTVKVQSDGGLLVTPARDWSGGEKIKIIAWDVWNKTTTVEIYITVWNTNQPPRINKQIANFTLQEDRVVELNISDAFYDPDVQYGDSLYYWWKNNVSIPMSLDNATLTLSFGPTHGFLGVREVVLYVRDSAKPPGQAYMKFTVTVNHTNHPPTLKGANRIDLISLEDTANQSLLARDFFYDEDTTYAKDFLTYTGVDSAHLNCTVGADGRIVVLPAPDWSGVESAYVKATDTGGLSVSIEVRMTVNAVNDPPRIDTYGPAADEVTMNETESLTLSVSASDIDSPPGSLTYKWFVDGITQPNATGPTFTFVTNQDSSRQLPYRITVEIGDGEFTTSRTWSVPVFNIKKEPSVNIISPKDGAVVSAQNLTSLRADVYDPEHGNLAYTWKDGNTTLGNLRIMSWKFSPGWHNVSIHVDYGVGTVVVSVTIFSNSQPTIEILQPGQESTRKTTDKVQFSASVYDLDGDPVTFQWLEGSKLLSTSGNFSTKLSKGLHYIKIRASDGRSSVESDEIIVKVEEPPKSGFVPGTETALIVVAAAVAGLLAVWRRRR
jgi:hypothetical protein